MRHDPLEILRRIRNFALEKEQRDLQVCEEDEQNKQALCRLSLAKIKDQPQPRPFVRISAETLTREGICIRYAAAAHENDLRQLALSQANYKHQLQKTLLAKQRRDQIDHLLERKRLLRQHEFDLQEHKLLDEFNQFNRDIRPVESL